MWKPRCHEFKRRLTIAYCQHVEIDWPELGDAEHVPKGRDSLPIPRYIQIERWELRRLAFKLVGDKKFRQLLPHF